MSERRRKRRWFEVEDESQRPWYKVWWVYALAAVVVILVMAFTAPSGDAAALPFALPD